MVSDATTDDTAWRVIATASGWALNTVCAIDEQHPAAGLAGRFLRAGSERRQVVAAYCAVTLTKGAEPVAPQVAKMLAASRSRTILEAAFGEVPIGLHGALFRTGQDIQERGYYRTLHRVLSDPHQTGAARVVRQVRNLSEARLHAILRLPEELRRPGIADQVADLATARDLAIAYDLIQKHGGAAPEALISALKAASRDGSISVWAGNWLDRLPFPPNPIPSSAKYRPVVSGRDLRRIALRYRNCARTLLISLVEGHSALGELDCDQGSVLVHLRHQEAGWVLDSINRPRNVTIDPSIKKEALAFLAGNGIATLSMPPRNYRFAALQRLARLADDWRWL